MPASTFIRPLCLGVTLLQSVGCGAQSQQDTEISRGNGTAGQPGLPTTAAVGSGGSQGTTGSIVGLDGASSGSTTTAGNACATESAEATLVKEPVDIVLVLDNSGSMSDELEAVERNINVNFSNILSASDVDYRVILISRHRVEDRGVSEAASTSICVTSPLSGLDACPTTSCSDREGEEDCYDGPVLSDRFFQYSTKVESTDSFDILLDTFGAPFDDEDKYDLAPAGWSEWLRPSAKKVFLEMTDDNAEMPVATFLAELTALRAADGSAPFGEDAAAPSFVWHSIIGIAEKATPTDPYAPDEPIQMAICTGNANTVENAGEAYQELSRLSGGLRFPLCQFNAYDAVFSTIAEDVVVKSSIACDFAIPEAPAAGSLDLDNVAVNHIPGQGAEGIKFGQVRSIDDCQADAFYIDGDRIVLCTEACAAVQAQPTSSVDVLFTCESQIIIK